LSDGKKMLWVRELDSLEPKALSGTEDASYPFWSPDGHSLAFMQRGKLKRIEITGGPAQTVCEIGVAFGGAWSSGGVIVFPPRIGVLYQVPAEGGTSKPVTTLDSARGEFAHQFPQFLPGSRHFLYFAVSSRPGESSIRVGSLDSSDSKFLLNADGSAVYAPTPHGEQGFLLFVYRGALMAQHFDPQSLDLGGERMMVAPDVSYASGRADVSASTTGVLAYRAAKPKDQQLGWFDREGKLLETVGQLNNYYAWSLSPDEKRLALQEVDPSGRGGAIWIMELDRGVSSRLTDVSVLFFPIWSPDGREILFSTGTDQAMSLQRQPLNGRTSLTMLDTPGPKFATDWSSDGRFVTYFTPWPDFKKLSIWITPVGNSNPLQSPALHASVVV
jgi:Tol biopolymer transport system component